MLLRKRSVYLDHNATTQPSPGVRERMADVLGAQYGNPSSIHRQGRDAGALVADARRQVAAVIGADENEIIFNSGATEGNNQVLRMVALQADPQRRCIVSTRIEHSSVLATLDDLAAQGFTIRYLSIDRFGRVSMAEAAAVIGNDTCLVSCMLANNETGTVQPVQALAELAHEHGALFHADCVQALGKMPLDMHAMGMDFATFSSHKIYGPKGAGVLYAREGAPLRAMITGGSHEQGRRSGTESTHNIAGTAAAFTAVPSLVAKMERVARRRAGFLSRLRDIKPDLVLNSPDDALPNTLNVRLPGVRNVDLLAFLDQYDVAISAGSACSASGGKPSHVLTALGLSDDEAHESIRLSMGGDTTEGDLEYVVRLVKRFVGGEVPRVNYVPPAAVDAAYLGDPRNYILDVRFAMERRLMRGIPNANEVPFLGFSRHLESIPQDRHVLVVCTGGINASIVARSLTTLGHPHVSVLRGGITAWRLIQPIKLRS